MFKNWSLIENQNLWIYSNENLSKLSPHEVIISTFIRIGDSICSRCTTVGFFIMFFQTTSQELIIFEEYILN